MNTLPAIAAVDGSDDSLRALDRALDAARRREAPLRVAHVREYGPWLRPETLTAAQPEPDTDQVLDLARDRLKGLGEERFLPQESVRDGSDLAPALARAADAFLASPDRQRLRACLAPRCVRYFRKDHPRQGWCTPSCGNRARVARHHERHKKTA
ncbi:universal stress protein [Streptomyces sp. NPDC017991]|uniref:universal stress protein n=1 Tax=Streptomyces sp. NPDC017991 TaxID=3365026 RepID=UPI003793ECBD